MPFFVLESWNFHHRPLAWSFSKHSGQIFFKLTFDKFWPLCNIKNANFAIFHARELKFSPKSPCLIFFITQWSILFQIDFWPLCNIKNANFAIFHARELKFEPQSPCLIFFITQWSIFFQNDFWPILTTVHHKNMLTLPFFKCQCCTATVTVVVYTGN